MDSLQIPMLQECLPFEHRKARRLLRQSSSPEVHLLHQREIFGHSGYLNVYSRLEAIAVTVNGWCTEIAWRSSLEATPTKQTPHRIPHEFGASIAKLPVPVCLQAVGFLVQAIFQLRLRLGVQVA